MIFSSCDVRDFGRFSRVSSLWKNHLTNSYLWRMVGLMKYGEYLSSQDLLENPREKVIQHHLSVIANMKGNSEELRRLVHFYNLRSYVPACKACITEEFLGYLIKNNSNILAGELEENEFLVNRGNKQAIVRKINALWKGGTY